MFLGEIHKRLAIKHFANLCDHEVILKKKSMRKKSQIIGIVCHCTVFGWRIEHSRL